MNKSFITYDDYVKASGKIPGKTPLSRNINTKDPMMKAR